MVHVRVTHDGGVVAGVGEFEVTHGLEVSDHSFSCLPVDPGGVLVELGQYGGRKRDVWLCSRGGVHKQPDDLLEWVSGALPVLYGVHHLNSCLHGQGGWACI